jgi:hypothetical protein
VFRLDDLAAGRYDVAASALDGSTGILEDVVVEPDEQKSGLSIRLVPGGHVRVRHERLSRFVRVSVLAHGVVFDGGSVERGTTLELTAPDGRVTVRAESGARVLERTVDVNAGRSTDVVFGKDAH